MKFLARQLPQVIPGEIQTLDTFWMTLNIALSQRSTEPVFITRWVQLQRDQGLGWFWVTSIVMAQLKPSSPFVNHFPRPLTNFPCGPPLSWGWTWEPCPRWFLSSDQQTRSLFTILLALLYLSPDSTEGRTQQLTLVFGSELVYGSHVSRTWSLTSNTNKDDASAWECL